MAHLVIPRAQDNSGNAASGAKLYVYETTTTTPAELYSTAALAAAGGEGDLANPLTADVSGWFVTVFVGENEVVDWQLRTSAGDLLREEEAVQGVPGGTEGVDLNFGDDGRLLIHGEGGVVQIETGDPTGDNIGGDARIGGWAGTQGGELELDYAELEVTGDATVAGDAAVTGGLTFDAGRTVDLVIGEDTLAAAATQTITIPTGYDIYELDLYSITSGVGASAFVMQFSYDNGSTYKSTNEYDWMNSHNGTVENLQNTTSMRLSDELLAGPAGEANHMRIVLYNLSDVQTVARWDGVVFGSTSTPQRVLGAGSTVAVYGKVTNIRFTNGSTPAFKYLLKVRRRRTA